MEGAACSSDGVSLSPVEESQNEEAEMRRYVAFSLPFLSTDDKPSLYEAFGDASRRLAIPFPALPEVFGLAASLGGFIIVSEMVRRKESG